MTKYRNLAIALLIGLSFAFLADFSLATTVSVTIPAGEEVTRKIDLAVEDRVRIQFTVVGTENSLIAFSIVYPNATEVSFGEIGVFSHGFVCDVEGEYAMHFVNKDTTENKLVTLGYDIEHYLFGLPQMLVLALVIAVICVTMVATYVLMSPRL
jgi:hypothetical protein